MSDNSIGDEGAFALSSALRKNKTLTKLSLMRESIVSWFSDVFFIHRELFSKQKTKSVIVVHEL